MTIDEAKYALKLMFCHDCPYAHAGDCSGKECKQAMDIICDAVDKQIPKKPTPDEHCPVCGWFLVTRDGNKMRFCSHCGQAVDLGE